MWPYPKVVAHRGGGKLAPENTLAGLHCGIEHGFHAVEFDVMLARDGVPVVMHDPFLGRTIPGSGKVSDYDAVELVAMDAGNWFAPRFMGEPVPLYTQFADACRAGGVWMNVEIKPAPGFEAETGRVVATLTQAMFGLQIAADDPLQVPLFSSFSTLALAAAQLAAPDIPRALLVNDPPAGWLEQAKTLGAVAIHANHQKLTRQFARQVKQAGFGLFCYTVNDPLRARELLGWGVDALCTDRIDIIGADFAG
ncbi:glycerophosphodiester phosphodiesterase [Massilia sp. RP-1-19]|uniref:Glycerophosphodiester phosphodiesterase n=1 Tax=Massilia polaris TaxID=2728846 RepID=A0A848HU67_9BURK|nr:glycerophosphodiester phosphodiesterase [Massilia polaris]NML62853.1 glycerophosphodiester phosphodiesterase [Massilia polaris]